MDTELTPAANECAGLGMNCLRVPNSSDGTSYEKRRAGALFAAHPGCVWSVTVKDPRRFPSKRHSSAYLRRCEGRPETESAEPIREREWRNLDVEISPAPSSPRKPRTDAEER